MSILEVVSLLGAVATFLFGMSTMKDGLETLSRGRLEAVLERLSHNIFKSVLVGAVVAGLLHSSAATIVMCVGFVNAGIMRPEQTVGIIMGANLGTTVTAQILRLGDLPPDRLPLALFRPNFLGPVLTAAGIVLYLFLRGGRKAAVGQICLGFGLIFLGTAAMESAVGPLGSLPAFRSVFTAFSHPLLGIFAGAAVTALIRSSTVSVGILQALTITGVITFRVAVPLLFGQNIGTCVTALFSAVGASKNAKRTALLHLMFNLFGTAVLALVLYAGNAIFRLPFWDLVMNRGDIANFHLFFNLASALLLLPLRRQMVALAEWLVPGTSDPTEVNFLDKRFLSSPSVALEKARNAVVSMGSLAHRNYYLSLELLNRYDVRKLERIHENETALDKLEDLLDDYLIHLNDRALTPEESRKASELLHTLSDFERIGDYVVNLTECSAALHQESIAFSPVAKRELVYLTAAVGEALEKTLAAYETRARALALQVEPLEEVVDLLRDKLRARHVDRLKAGSCTIELGIHFLELLANLERISDHCSNIAVYILRQTATPGDQILQNSHAYLRRLHAGGSEEFDALFEQYRAKYYGPLETQ